MDRPIDRVWLRYRLHRQAFRRLWPFRNTINPTPLCLIFIMCTKVDNWSVLWCSTAPRVMLEAGKAQQVRHAASLVGLWTHCASQLLCNISLTVLQIIAFRSSVLWFNHCILNRVHDVDETDNRYTAVMLTRTGHARTRTRTKPIRTRTRTRTSLTVTYCKLQLNPQSLSSNNNEHKVKIHNIWL